MAIRAFRHNFFGEDVDLRTTSVTRYLVPVGRALYSVMFVLAVLSHFKPETIQYAASAGVPAPQVLVPLSGIMATLGGLSVLIGFRARIGAWLIVAFLVPVTLGMHAFWTYADPVMRMTQQVAFLKNLSMLGAALLITYFGAGPFSFDAQRSRERTL